MTFNQYCVAENKCNEHMHLSIVLITRLVLNFTYILLITLRK